MIKTNLVTGQTPALQPPRASTRIAGWLSRYWFGAFLVIWGIFVILPFAAPLMMETGWSGMGRAIYFLYSFTCHQLPERSFFLFGDRFTHSLAAIQTAWQDTLNPAVLRRFIGNPDMGWKVAWSDRMVALYGSIWLWAMLWYPLRRRIPRLPWWGLILLLLPMVVDGTTHFLSDLAGVDQGFRATNDWLAALTGYRLPLSFTSGDAWGSLNSILRLVTGTLFGLGIVWFGLPYLAEAVEGTHPGQESTA